VTTLIELDRVSRTFHTPDGPITAVDAVSLALDDASGVHRDHAIGELGGD